MQQAAAGAPRARHSAVAVLGGQQHNLGSYKHQAMADIATDLAELLYCHFAVAAAAENAGGKAAALQLPQLRCLEAEHYTERREWRELLACGSLEDALDQLVESELAEQVGGPVVCRVGQAGCADVQCGQCGLVQIDNVER